MNDEVTIAGTPAGPLTWEEVPVLEEKERGCGHRKEGGLYLMAGPPTATCGKLPYVLDVCPTCGEGFKHNRGWTWIEPAKMLKEVVCNKAVHFEGEQVVRPAKGKKSKHPCTGCYLRDLDALGRCGLLWIGKEFYKTPGDYLAEAHDMGFSRRLKAVPKDFQLGKTIVLLAHVEATWEPCTGPAESDDGKCLGTAACECKGCGLVPVPGIFAAFRPERIEYVCHEKPSSREIPAELDALRKRGISPVRVKPIYNQSRLFEEGDDA